MRNNLLFTGVFILVLSSCGPTIYKASNFENSRNSIKTVAILPFLVSIDSKRLPKGMTIETLKESEQKTGYDMQNAAYTWLLHRQDEYSATFQDVDKTNALLKKANISFESLSLQDKGEICRLLNVDAVISGKAISSKPMSEGVAVTMTLLVGAAGPTNKTAVTLTIHNSSSKLHWKYDYDATGGLGSSPQQLTKGIKKIPLQNKLGYRRTAV